MQLQGAFLVGGGNLAAANPVALALTDESAQPSSSSSSLQVALPYDANALDVLLRQAKANQKEELQKNKEKDIKISQDLQVLGTKLDAASDSDLAKITLKKEIWNATSGRIFGIPCSDCSGGLIPVTPCVPGNHTALGLDLSAVVMHEAWKDL